jgi:hypothetical protein
VAAGCVDRQKVEEAWQIMTNGSDDDVRELAARVVRLMVREPAYSGNGITEEYRQQMTQRYFDEQTELRVKHYTVEQLQALLDFYSSAMGRSILDSQNRMLDAMGPRIVSGPAE